MTCRACGNLLPEESAFCPECGVKRGAGRVPGEAGWAVRLPVPRVDESSGVSKDASLPAVRLAPRASIDALLARANLLRMLNPPESLVEDKGRNRYQRDGIDQGDQHSGAMVSVSLGSAGRPRLQIDCNQRKQESQKIRQVVPGLGE